MITIVFVVLTKKNINSSDFVYCVRLLFFGNGLHFKYKCLTVSKSQKCMFCLSRLLQRPLKIFVQLSLWTENPSLCRCMWKDSNRYTGLRKLNYRSLISIGYMNKTFVTNVFQSKWINLKLHCLCVIVKELPKKGPSVWVNLLLNQVPVLPHSSCHISPWSLAH